MDTKIILVICAAIFILIVLSFLFRFVFVYQKKTIALNAEKELIKAQYQEELLKSQLEIQEQTFKNISQEIHDNIGQTLSLVKLHLNRIDLQKPKSGAEKIQDSKELLTKAIQDLRTISKSLNTDVIASSGLLKIIEFQLLNIERTGIFKTRLIVNGIQHSLGAERELILFRIVQEGLNNAMKHSGASELKVICDYNPAHFILSISDNGKGFDRNKGIESEAGGSGMHNMANRAKLIGGLFSVKSSAEGTNIRIELPIVKGNGNINSFS